MKKFTGVIFRLPNSQFSTIRAQMEENELKIVRATITDEDRIFDFLAKHYYPNNPLYKAAQHKMEKEDCPSPIILKSNLSFLAVRKDNPEIICGVLMDLKLGDYNDELDALFNRRIKKYAGTAFGRMSQLLRDNSKVLNEQVAKQCWKGIDKGDTIKACIISVLPEYRRKRAAFSLGQCGMQMARNQNYRWYVAEAVSFFSQQMGAKMGFKVLTKVRYNDYFKDQNGRIVLSIEPPHDSICSIVKDLSLLQRTTDIII